MPPNWKFNTLCGGPAPISFEAMLAGITSRPDADCEAAWEFFDENQREETMLTIQNFAAMGGDTRQIWTWLWQWAQHCGSFQNDIAKELAVLCIERAVRREQLIPK